MLPAPPLPSSVLTVTGGTNAEAHSAVASSMSAQLSPSESAAGIASAPQRPELAADLLLRRFGLRLLQLLPEELGSAGSRRPWSVPGAGLRAVPTGVGRRRRRHTDARGGLAPIVAQVARIPRGDLMAAGPYGARGVAGLAARLGRIQRGQRACPGAVRATKNAPPPFELKATVPCGSGGASASVTVTVQLVGPEPSSREAGVQETAEVVECAAGHRRRPGSGGCRSRRRRGGRSNRLLRWWGGSFRRRGCRGPDDSTKPQCKLQSRRHRSRSCPRRGPNGPRSRTSGSGGCPCPRRRRWRLSRW